MASTPAAETDETHQTHRFSEGAHDARLLSGSHAVGALPLCDVRLQDDARWPWLVLIPRRHGLRELEDLAGAERAALMEEAVRAGRAVRRIGAATGFGVAKLNVGALGNIVPQLHLHVVGRAPGDAAWPGPAWGVSVAVPYRAADLADALAAARETLGVAAPEAPR